ncbi:M15 family metallopeptidase [Cellulomonas sp. HZM]|uniref:M15 family metallopeptidase n=1 Tax=Cellulomonas sp. HZM TaxID=1454010 RepID=UPI000493A2EB|nr:M15 family metallopeptidase [Cellulomonas sp. HZM]
MAVKTNNGFPRLSGLVSLKTIKVRKQTTRVRTGDAGTILGWVARQIDADVEPCQTLYGWRSPATNTAAGGVGDSNHLSGTAIDYNGGKHPYERTWNKTHPAGSWRPGWSADAVKDIHAILAAASGVVVWGNDVSSRYAVGWRDAMHFEVRASAAALKRATDKLRGGTVHVTADVLNGRAKPSTAKPVKVLYRRKRGFKITYTQVLYREGRLWLKTRYGTYYAAEHTSW